MTDETIIIVPCYNEAARLNVAAYDEFLAGGGGVSLLFVNDGSSDNTAQVLERLRAAHASQVSVLGLGTNVGKAEAVRRGVKLALRRSPALVGYWDADLATPLDAIHDFRDVLVRRPDLELVMGSRVALLGRQIRRSWKRHLLGRAFATTASIVLKLPVYDTQCGAKLFRVTRRTAALFDRSFRTRWIFDVELLARMLTRPDLVDESRVQNVVYEFPLLQWEDVEGSRLKSHDFFTAAADLAAIYWQYMRRAPRTNSVPPVVVPQPVHRKAA